MAENPSTPVVEHPKRGHDQDPSPLVIQMVQREILQLEEKRVAAVDALRREVVTRLDAMDKALTIAQNYPTDIDLASARLREYVNEKFESVEIRFRERDKRFDLRDQGNIALLNEQRISSQQAISKAEVSVAQQLETQMRQVRDLKERLDKEEGKTAGAVMLWGILVAVIATVGTIVAIVATLAA